MFHRLYIHTTLTCLVAVLLALNLISCSKPQSDADQNSQNRVENLNESINFELQDDGEAADGIVRRAPKIKYIASIKPPKSEQGNPLPLQATAFDFLWDTKYAAVVYNYAGNPIEGGLDIVVSAGYDQDTLYTVSHTHYDNAEFNDLVSYQNDGDTFIAMAGHDIEGAIVRVVYVASPNDIRIVKDIRVPGFVVTSLRKASDFDRSRLLYGISGDQGVAFAIDSLSLETKNLAKVENGSSILDFDHEVYMIAYDAYMSDTAIGPIFKEELLPTNLLNVNRRLEAPARMVKSNEFVYSNVGNRLTVYSYNGRPTSALNREFFGIKKLPGTSNGLDAYSKHLVLAQGKSGALYYNLSNPLKPKLIGRFDFKRDNGSANNIKIGPQYQHPENTLAFISDGVGGIRLIQISN